MKPLKENFLLGVFLYGALLWFRNFILHGGLLRKKQTDMRFLLVLMDGVREKRRGAGGRDLPPPQVSSVSSGSRNVFLYSEGVIPL